MAFRYTNEPDEPPTPTPSSSAKSKRTSNLKERNASSSNKQHRVSFASTVVSRTIDNDDDYDDDDDDITSTVAAAASSSTTPSTTTATIGDDTDAELELEAKRAWLKLGQQKLIHGIDFDDFAAMGASSASARGRGAQVQRRQEVLAELQRTAVAQLEQGDFEASFATCLEMVRTNARSKEAYLLLAEIMERKPEPDLHHALDYLSLATQFHKRDVELWKHIADRACAVQVFETAILANRMILKYGEQRINRAEVMHQLALCYENNRDDEKAHRQVIELIKHPVGFPLVIGVAVQLYKYGEVERAIEFVCRQLSMLGPTDTAYRNNFAAVLTQMYRENYLHQECVVFLGLLLGAPREQFQPVIDQLATEASESATREARAQRDKRTKAAAAAAAADDDVLDDDADDDADDGDEDDTTPPIVITARNIPAMLPLATVKLAGLLTEVDAKSSAAGNVNTDDDDDDDDDEAALFGVSARATAPAEPAKTWSEATRVVNERGVTLLNGNVLLGNEPPSIDLVTPYACSLAECVGLPVAQPLFEYLLAIEGEFDLHIRIARTLMETGAPALAQSTLERIFEAMTASGAASASTVPPKLVALLLQLYSMCCERLVQPLKSYELHRRALDAFPMDEAVVVRVAQEFEMHGEYEHARDTLYVLYRSHWDACIAAIRANNAGVSVAVIEDEALERLIATFPKLVAMYIMMALFVGGSEAAFMKAGRAILASRVHMHAPLSSQKFDKLTAQRAHLRARQGAEVGGEVQSLIVALGPELYADLCTQVGYFLVEGGAEEERARALLIAENALDAQRMGPAVRRSRRLSRKVQFNDDAVARLAWIAVRAANNTQDRGKYARMMLKHAPNSSYVWQLLISEPALQSTLAQLVGDVERRANALPPTPASAVPFTARGLYQLKQNHAVHAISAFDNALQRQPHATLPALLLAVAAVRQASATAAHSDTLAQAMSSLYHYASLRLEPAPEHGAESILPDDLRRAEVSYNFGRALHSLGWFDQAEAFYLGAINALRGDSHELFVRIAAHNLSLLYEQRGERTQAAAVVQQYMKFF